MRGLGALVVLSLLLAGCAGGSDVSNKKNHFSFEMGGAGMSIDQTWYWDTDGGDVRVRIDMGGAGGSATVTVRDPLGTVLFQETFKGAGGREHDTTLQGTIAGSWEIEIEASGITGGLDVRIDKL